MAPKFVSRGFLVKKGICSDYELDMLVNSNRLKSYDANGYELSPYRVVGLNLGFSSETYFFTGDIVSYFGENKMPDIDTKRESEERARQWRELAETLQGQERKAALCAACKWEGMTHIETYDALSLGNAKKDKSKREAVTRLKPVAEALKSKYGHLEMPEWRAA